MKEKSADEIAAKLGHAFCSTLKHGEDAHMIAVAFGFKAGCRHKEKELEKLKKDAQFAFKSILLCGFDRDSENVKYCKRIAREALKTFNEKYGR